jgi:hypothetical protein
MRVLLLIIVVLGLYGCVYPARIKMPIRTQVVDAETGQPIAGARLLQIVCDVHDFGCTHAEVDCAQSNQEGFLEVSGKRQWGFWFPAPGGLPVPNHQVAIWKDGYYAFVFSQYGDFEDFQALRTKKRQDLAHAIAEIPTPRKQYFPNDEPEWMFSDGQIKLYRLNK